MISWKYVQMSADGVVEDFRLHGSRELSRGYVQSVSREVAEVALEHERRWHYELPKMKEVIATIAVSRDGAMMPIRGEGYREAMTGTLALFDRSGRRMHTIYVGSAPEYGTKNFEESLDYELEQLRRTYASACVLGIADGAQSNWRYLDERSEVQILDFYHATEYLAEISHLMELVCSEQSDSKGVWFERSCSRLKHEKGAAAELCREMRAACEELGPRKRSEVERVITYFTNNLHRMDYPQYLRKGYAIGSGVCEAGCKVLVKQRLCESGMRWNIPGADDMLLLRSISMTTGRWEQFWKHWDQQGYDRRL